MKKIKEFAKEHKALTIIIGISLLLLIILIIVTLSLLLGGGNNKYGERLKGIEKVKIDSKTLTNIENTIAENESVKNATLRIQGKIVYINIKFNKGTDLQTSEEISSKTLEEFDNDELEFYDFEFLLEEDTDSEDGFIKAGTKHPSKETITWTRG